MGKKRLVMILGAGSSIPCGMPGVGDIDALMCGWAAEYAASRGVPDYFALAWVALTEHSRLGFASARQPVTFERVLSDLVALMHWLRPAPEGGALRALVGAPVLPPNLAFTHPQGFGPSLEVKGMVAHLLARLGREMRARCNALAPDFPELLRWRQVLDGLRDRFEVAIYNLNYDTVALSCWPGASTGFGGDGCFDPASVHRRDWEGLFHLHGSVHFSLADPVGERICWKDDLGGRFIDSDDRSADYGSNDNDFLRSTLVAGGFTLDQLLVEPFHTYRSALVRDAALADAIVIGGYGFTDAHVNRALRGPLLHALGRPPVLVLDWAGERTDPLDFREDRWSHALTQSLHAGGRWVGAGGGVPERPWDLVAQGRCELSVPHRVALWYGGFTGAAPIIGRLAGWLDCGDDGLLG